MSITGETNDAAAGELMLLIKTNLDAQYSDFRPRIPDNGHVRCMLVGVVVRALDMQSSGLGVRIPAAALPNCDPGQVVHTCPVLLKLRPYGAIEI